MASTTREPSQAGGSEVKYLTEPELRDVTSRAIYEVIRCGPAHAAECTVMQPFADVPIVLSVKHGPGSKFSLAETIARTLLKKALLASKRKMPKLPILRRSCPHCGGPGVRRGARNGVRKWTCKHCGKNFTFSPSNKVLIHQYGDLFKKLVWEEGRSLKEAAGLIPGELTPNSVRAWYRRFVREGMPELTCQCGKPFIHPGCCVARDALVWCSNCTGQKHAVGFVSDTSGEGHPFTRPLCAICMRHARALGTEVKMIQRARDAVQRARRRAAAITPKTRVPSRPSPSQGPKQPLQTGQHSVAAAAPVPL